MNAKNSFFTQCRDYFGIFGNTSVFQRNSRSPQWQSEMYADVFFRVCFLIFFFAYAPLEAVFPPRAIQRRNHTVMCPVKKRLWKIVYGAFPMRQVRALRLRTPVDLTRRGEGDGKTIFRTSTYLCYYPWSARSSRYKIFVNTRWVPGGCVSRRNIVFALKETGEIRKLCAVSGVHIHTCHENRVKSSRAGTKHTHINTDIYIYI